MVKIIKLVIIYSIMLEVCNSIGLFQILSLYLAFQTCGIKNQIFRLHLMHGYARLLDCQQLPNFGITSRQRIALLKRATVTKLLISRMFGRNHCFHHTEKNKLFNLMMSQCVQHKVEKGLSLREILSPFSLNMSYVKLTDFDPSKVCFLIKNLPYYFQNMCLPVLQPEFAFFLRNMGVVLKFKKLTLDQNPFLFFLLNSSSTNPDPLQFQTWISMRNDRDIRWKYNEYNEFFAEISMLLSQNQSNDFYSNIKLFELFYTDILMKYFQEIYTFSHTFKKGDEESIGQLCKLYQRCSNKSDYFFQLRLPPSSSIDKGIYQSLFDLVNYLNTISVDFDWVDWLRESSNTCLCDYEQRICLNSRSKNCRFLVIFYEFVIMIQSNNKHLFQDLLFWLHVETAQSQKRRQDVRELKEQIRFFKRSQKEICHSSSFLEYDRICSSFSPFFSHYWDFQKFLSHLIQMNRTRFLEVLVFNMNESCQKPEPNPNYLKLLLKIDTLIFRNRENKYNSISDGIKQIDSKECRMNFK